MQSLHYALQVLLLSVVSDTLRTSGYEPTMLKHTIDTLNKHFELTLNLFVMMPREVEFWEVLMSGTNVSKLIIEEPQAAVQIFGRFNEKLLAVTFVEPHTALEVMPMLVRLLWKLHFKDILFTYTTPPNEKQLLALFSHCWHNGFINVLVLFNSSLYSYHPFPTLKVVQLTQLSAYYDKRHLQNFQRYTLRSQISNNSPRSYHFWDRKGQLVSAGYIYQMLMTFIQHHNGTFEELHMPTCAINLTNVIDAFAAKKIDILAALLYMYPNYSHSIVVYNFKTYIMVPYASEINSWLYLIKPLSVELWLVLLASVGYAVIMLTFARWLNSNVLDFGGSFLLVMNTILFLPSEQDFRQQTRIQNTFLLILISAGFLLTNIYQTNLASMLISKVYEPQIDSIADIARTNLMLPQTLMDTAYLYRMSGIPKVVYERLYRTTPEMVHRLRRDLNTSFMHSGVEDKVDFFLYQQKFLKVPYFKKIDEVLYQLPFFLAVPHGSPFLPLLNRYLRQIFDTGILQKMLDDSAEEGVLSGEIRFFRREDNSLNPLTLTHLAIMFSAWSFGVLLATACFIFEIIQVLCSPN